MSYLDKYIDDLYCLRINFSDISKKENVSRSKVGKDFKKTGLISPWVYYSEIDTGVPEMDFRLKQRYNSIVTRCNGKNNNPYHKKSYQGMEYMPIYDWVDFCNSQKGKLMSMWDDYTESGRIQRYTVSIDRIDNNKGYTKDNVQFVTYGFNAWKRNVTPLSVTHNEKTKYFMSGEEAGNYYGIRNKSIKDILRGQYRIVSKDYKVEYSTMNDVLNHNRIDSLEEYYNILEGECCAIY